MEAKRIRLLLLMTLAVSIALSVGTVFGYAYTSPDLDQVTGIEFEPAGGPIKLEEYIDGHIDEDEGLFYYQVSSKIYVDGSTLILINADSTRSKFVYDSSEEAFIGEGGYSIERYEVGTDASDRQWDEQWGLGPHTFTIGYDDFEFDLTATVVENSIDKVEYIPHEPYDFVEYCNGYWDEDEYDNEYYCYYYSIEDKDKIKVTMKDSTVKTYVYEYDEEYEDDYYIFRCSDGTWISSQDIDLTDNQYEHHWVKGGKYSITFNYAGKESKIPVRIVESPIESVSYEPVSPLVCTEGVNCEVEEDKYEKEYFEYEIDLPKNGDKLTVVKDGRTLTYTYSSDEECFVGEEGRIQERDVDFVTNQYKKHWTLGSDNELTVWYLGQKSTVKVTIQSNSINSIAYIPAAPYEYVENNKKQGEWDVDYDDNPFFWYYTPRMQDGDRLIVTRGSVDKEYVYNDDRYSFISSDGEVINADDVYFQSKQDEEPWKPDKQNYMTVEYNGRECKVPVVIKLKNTMSAKSKPVKIKYSKLKKKDQKIKKKAAFKVSKAVGKVTYSLAKKDPKAKKKIKISKSGVITVKKGLKKGKYTIKVKVKAAGNGTYGPASKTVKVKISVK
ncbi:MAG: hypothetical protein IKF07_05325 [Eubacterium sp.]|nr:hypothetical protein [Eubacterium sp.]